MKQGKRVRPAVLIAAILFYGLILLFFLRNRKKFVVQGRIFAIYRTKLGLNLMDKIGNVFRKPLRILAYLSILVGFAVMFFIVYWLIKGTIALLLIPDAAPAVAPVLPGIKVPGLPTLGFWHWIIAIFIVAVVHEMSHGVLARVFKIKLNIDISNNNINNTFIVIAILFIFFILKYLISFIFDLPLCY